MQDFGILILRLNVGILMFLHGLQKVFSGIDGIKASVTAFSLPEFVAYGVYLGELVAPFLIILGIFTRLSSLAVLCTMIFASLVVLGGNVEGYLALNQHGGWIVELQALYAFSSLALIFLGAGKYALYNKF